MSVHSDIYTSLYGQTVRLIYEISGDPNTLVWLSAYVWCPQGKPVSRVTLHGILPIFKTKVFYVYTTCTSSDVTIYAKIAAVPQTRLAKRHPVNNSNIIIIGILMLLPFSNSIQVTLFRFDMTRLLWFDLWRGLFGHLKRFSLVFLPFYAWQSVTSQFDSKRVSNRLELPDKK